MNKVNKIVTDKIVTKIKQAIEDGGIAPWQKPWYNAGVPVNYVTGRPYRGINLLLLKEGGEYLTFNQIKDLQAKNSEVHLRKGAKASMVVFFKPVKVEKDDTEAEQEAKTFAVMRYYNVFSIKDIDGLESRRVVVEHHHDPIEGAEAIVSAYFGREGAPTLSFNDGQKACYTPATDDVCVPRRELYENGAEYYSTLFHETTHSTGHPSRLGRFDTTGVVNFGDTSYSKEELVAEIGSAMLCGIAGIDNAAAANNSVAYLKGWLKALQDDETLIVSAAAKAQKAVDFILGEPAAEAETAT